MGAWTEVWADLVSGRRCVACGHPGVSWCGSCARRLRPDPVEVSAGVWASGAWVEPVRSVVLAWKLGQVSALDTWCAWHLAAAVVALDPPDVITLVPVPSTRRSRRQRGRHLVRDLAVGASRQLRELGVHAQVADLVRLARQPVDQSALSRAERQRNLHGSMRAVGAPRAPVVLVDDIVTTGATLAEMRRVLARADPGVLGAAAIAAVGV